MFKQAILLINLGTPDHCDPASVKHYLSQFLNDKRVIDLPAWLRYPLVNAFIVPLRYRKVAKAYQKIWLDIGSPLLVYSEQLKQTLAEKLGDNYQVELGMRYGQPSIETALASYHWDEIDSLTVLPLFPQYSSAATGSALEVVFKFFAKQWNLPSLTVQHDFYAHPAYITAYADMIKKHTQGRNIDLLLFSYHGLPERHINKSHCHAGCDHLSPCPPITANNLYCYRGQCYASSQLIAKELAYSSDQYAVSFQSRLGRTPWIKPYTDLLLPDLIKQGRKNIAIVSPSFVMDCLETLEEINIRLRQQWLSLGGKEFIFIPCLNNSPLLLDMLIDLIPKN